MARQIALNVAEIRHVRVGAERVAQHFAPPVTFLRIQQLRKIVRFVRPIRPELTAVVAERGEGAAAERIAVEARQPVPFPLFRGIVDQNGVVGDRAPAVLHVVGRFVQRVVARVDGQGAFVVNLERAGVEVLVAGEEELVHANLGQHVVGVQIDAFRPSRAADHPAVGRTEIARQGQVADRARLHERIGVDELPHGVELSRFVGSRAVVSHVIAQELPLQVTVLIIAGRHHPRPRMTPVLAVGVLVVFVGVAVPQERTVRPARVQVPIQGRLLAPVKYVHPAHCPEQEGRGKVAVEGAGTVRVAPVVLARGVEPIAHVDVPRENGPGHRFVNLWILVVHCDRPGKLIAQHLILRPVPADGPLLIWWIADLHIAGQLQESPLPCGPPARIHQFVAPVVHHGPGKQHRADGAGVPALKLCEEHVEKGHRLRAVLATVAEQMTESLGPDDGFGGRLLGALLEHRVPGRRHQLGPGLRPQLRDVVRRRHEQPGMGRGRLRRPFSPFAPGAAIDRCHPLALLPPLRFRPAGQPPGGAAEHVPRRRRRDATFLAQQPNRCERLRVSMRGRSSPARAKGFCSGQENTRREIDAAGICGMIDYGIWIGKAGIAI